MDMNGIRLDDADWIHLVQDKNQWQSFVTTVTNLRRP